MKPKSTCIEDVPVVDIHGKRKVWMPQTENTQISKLYQDHMRAFEKWRHAVAVWARSRTQGDKDTLEKAKTECLKTFRDQ